MEGGQWKELTKFSALMKCRQFKGRQIGLLIDSVVRVFIFPVKLNPVTLYCTNTKNKPNLWFFLAVNNLCCSVAEESSVSINPIQNISRDGFEVRHEQLFCLGVLLRVNHL
jgi:hypothetical protein